MLIASPLHLQLKIGQVHVSKENFSLNLYLPLLFSGHFEILIQKTAGEKITNLQLSSLLHIVEWSKYFSYEIFNKDKKVKTFSRLGPFSANFRILEF